MDILSIRTEQWQLSSFYTWLYFVIFWYFNLQPHRPNRAHFQQY